MDQSFLLMLSNLLHLHNYLDPTTSPLLSSTTLSSAAADATSTSAAPLLFFALASVLSYLASHPPNKRNPKSSSPSPSSSAAKPPSEFSVAAFRALSTEHIWAMEAPLRDAQWRSLYGLSYPVFTTVVEKLKPYITQSQLSLPRIMPLPWSSPASPTA
ncbi:UNVERIFIED_CONTAM: hypothetical protein Sangu_0641100 [Sesamum angustifolium]|uniref:Uncharacterized protein n=1 Tax=Sesamum angustifolium TaxID=2727405 RepID=A0AAW2QC71_9LAMI